MATRDEADCMDLSTSATMSMACDGKLTLGYKCCGFEEASTGMAGSGRPRGMGTKSARGLKLG